MMTMIIYTTIFDWATKFVWPYNKSQSSKYLCSILYRRNSITDIEFFRSQHYLLVSRTASDVLEADQRSSYLDAYFLP